MPALWPYGLSSRRALESASLHWGLWEGRRLQLGGLVHENKDFCGRENKIVASVHKKSRSDGQSLTEIDSRGWTKGTKQRSEPFGVARVACFERLAGIFASRVFSLTKCPVSQSRSGQGKA